MTKTKTLAKKMTKTNIMFRQGGSLPSGYGIMSDFFNFFPDFFLDIKCDRAGRG